MGVLSRIQEGMVEDSLKTVFALLKVPVNTRLYLYTLLRNSYNLYKKSLECFFRWFSSHQFWKCCAHLSTFYIPFIVFFFLFFLTSGGYLNTLCCHNYRQKWSSKTCCYSLPPLEGSLHCKNWMCGWNWLKVSVLLFFFHTWCDYDLGFWTKIGQAGCTWAMWAHRGKIHFELHYLQKGHICHCVPSVMVSW